jgi:phosphoglycerate kinase
MNDESYSKYLASLADIYVNDAFAASHREHASIIGIPRYLPSYIGIEFADEIKNLSLALDPERPSLFILGGAKFDTKEPLIKKFLDLYDRVFVGGALANDLFKAQGFEIGRSLSSGTEHSFKEILDHPNLVLPADVVVVNKEGVATKKPKDVLIGDMILDAGVEATQQVIQLTKEASFVLWNGPLGDYEKGFNDHTEELARAIVESDAKCIVGGGDTVASISKLGLMNKIDFVSTGGGAMLQFLLEGTLPGIEAIKESKFT